YARRGDSESALRHFQQALPICRQAGDRTGEATILNNIGMVYNQRGDNENALHHYQQALPIHRQVGNRAGEAVTRYKIAMQLRAAGRLDEAVAELEIVVTLDRAVQRPGLDADTAMLQRVRAELTAGAGQGGV